MRAFDFCLIGPGFSGIKFYTQSLLVFGRRIQSLYDLCLNYKQRKHVNKTEKRRTRGSTTK